MPIYMQFIFYSTKVIDIFEFTVVISIPYQHNLLPCHYLIAKFMIFINIEASNYTIIQ